MSQLEPSNRHKCSLINFIKLYFDYSYFLCLCPFRFVSDGDRGFITQTWLPQKVLTGLAHTFSILMLINDLRDKLFQPSKDYNRNPVAYFQILDSLFNLAYKSTLIKRVWWNRQDFLFVFEFIWNRKSLNNTSNIILKPIVVHTLFIFYSLLAGASLIAGKGFVSSLYEWTPSWWFRRIVALGRHAFFIDGPLPSKYAPELSNITTVEYILAGLMATGLISRFILGFFIDLCILSMTLTLWSVIHSFSLSIQSDSYHKWMSKNYSTLTLTQNNTKCKSWQSIFYEWDTIRRLSLLINNAMGSLVIWFLLEALMYYSVNMDAFLLAKDVFKKSYLFAYYFGTLTIFVFSGNICNELEEIKSWLVDDENRKPVGYHDLKLILHEMIEKTIGIRGMGVFTMSYSSFATFGATIVTFFIICILQQQTTK
ncbi:unnamed protein product [Orchesella dallaii]|uniref:Gustatory receptor n=1 Tax=Orchesella dallaii TaxID=48710 RepID=A0ABP1PP86_9HEXA